MKHAVIVFMSACMPALLAHTTLAACMKTSYHYGSKVRTETSCNTALVQFLCPHGCSRDVYIPSKGPTYFYGGEPKFTDDGAQMGAGLKAKAQWEKYHPGCRIDEAGKGICK